MNLLPYPHSTKKLNLLNNRKNPKKYLQDQMQDNPTLAENMSYYHHKTQAEVTLMCLMCVEY